MIINLQSNKEGVWFPFFYSRIDSSTMEVAYDDPIEDGPRMKIRNPAPFFKERAKTRKTKSEMVLNKKSRAMERVTSEVELSAEEKKKEDDDFKDYVIMEFEGFKLDGKEVSCNRETKIEIMDIPIVAMYVHRCVEILQERGATEEKDTLKNSQSGANGLKSKAKAE